MRLCLFAAACNRCTSIQIVVEGEDGDYFYIIKEGEAVVHQSTPGGQRRKVNHLFRADFFGERALLVKEPRIATVSRMLCCWMFTRSTQLLSTCVAC